MVELTACPFCGGDARRVDLDDLPEDDPNAGGSLIECTKCGACTAVHFGRKENLLDSWNRRALSGDREGR
jgi:Lar family restriction alleviation protein